MIYDVIRKLVDPCHTSLVHDYLSHVLIRTVYYDRVGLFSLSVPIINPLLIPIFMKRVFFSSICSYIGKAMWYLKGLPMTSYSQVSSEVICTLLRRWTLALRHISIFQHSFELIHHRKRNRWKYLFNLRSLFKVKSIYWKKSINRSLLTDYWCTPSARNMARAREVFYIVRAYFARKQFCVNWKIYINL